MALIIRRVQVWSCEIPDRPGSAAAKLACLAQAGADVEFIFTRARPTSPETSMLFLAPINGEEQINAARNAGLAPAFDIHMLCVQGDLRPGISYEIMSQLAIGGINLRGISISSVDSRFAAYLAFDNADTAAKATQILATIEP